MDSRSVIDLKDGDAVLAAAEARDDDRLVFVSTDSSLLTFEAKNVRPQGRTAGGMAGIRLAEGCSVAAFAVIPADKVTWNYEEGENGLFSASGAVVLTVRAIPRHCPAPRTVRRRSRRWRCIRRRAVVRVVTVHNDSSRGRIR